MPSLVGSEMCIRDRKHSTLHAPLPKGTNGTPPMFGIQTGCSTYLIEWMHTTNGNAALPRPTILTSLNGSNVHTRKNAASGGDDHGVPIWAPHRARRRLPASFGPSTNAKEPWSILSKHLLVDGLPQVRKHHDASWTPTFPRTRHSHNHISYTNTTRFLLFLHVIPTLLRQH